MIFMRSNAVIIALARQILPTWGDSFKVLGNSCRFARDKDKFCLVRTPTVTLA